MDFFRKTTINNIFSRITWISRIHYKSDETDKFKCRNAIYQRRKQYNIPTEKTIPHTKPLFTPNPNYQNISLANDTTKKTSTKFTIMTIIFKTTSVSTTATNHFLMIYSKNYLYPFQKSYVNSIKTPSYPWKMI